MGEKDIATGIVKRLREAEFEAYFVGGCVRDMLMGRESAEHDIATSAMPEEVSAVFQRVIPVGRQFGVMLVIEQGHSFHVATFRSDMEYQDGRKPSGVVFSSAREDVQRRDFTVNALLYDPLEGRLIDFVNGGRDIRNKIIRTIGDPRERFGEDKLRLLRAVRFSSTLGFTIEEKTLAAIKELAHEIGVVSQERIRDELVKILIRPRAGTGLELLDGSGLLKQILPEVDAMKGVSQPQGFHPEGDVFEHTKRMLNAMREPSVVLAFSVLLHDVGKPQTHVVRDRIRFPRHQKVGAEITRDICNRLRFPGHIRDAIVACVEHHMAFLDAKRMKEVTLKRLFGRPTFLDELELHRLDCLASDGDLSAWEYLTQKREEYSREEISPRPIVRGQDLLALGYPEGPLIGEILRAVREMQLENKLKNRGEALAWVNKRWKQKEGRS
jgi:poly(A) polymerase